MNTVSNPCPDSLLVIPADRLDEYVPNARETEADAILFDLEDSVSEERKPRAREKLADIRKRDLCSKDIYVRPNRIGTEVFERDRETLEEVSPDLPKVW